MLNAPTVLNDPGWTVRCSKNKDADQLCGYCTAHMHLCYAYANSGFPHDVALMDAGTGSSIHQRGQAEVIEV